MNSKKGHDSGIKAPNLSMSLAEIDSKTTPNNGSLKVYNNKRCVKAIVKIQGAFRGFIFRKKLRDFGVILSKLELDDLNKRIKEFMRSKSKPTNRLKFDFELNVNEGWKKYYDEEDNELAVINESVEKKILLYCLGYFSNFSKIESLYTGYLDTKFKYNGMGKLYFKNGAEYEGFFNNGKLNGWGRYTDKLGNCYEGLFLNGTLTGKGVEIRPDEKGKSILYEGDFKKFIKEGFGTETCEEYVYEGGFKDNVKHGQGKLHYKNTSDVYEGEFTNGSITGYGYYTWDNKHSYLGDFVDGKMHGSGLYKWPDGSEYKGEYVENIKEGQGEFKWKDGRVYKGPFVRGKPHGKGVLVVKDITIEGTFINGKFDGNLKEILKQKKLELRKNESSIRDDSIKISVNSFIN